MNKLQSIESMMIKRMIGIRKRSLNTELLYAIGLNTTMIDIKKRKLRFLLTLLENQTTYKIIKSSGEYINKQLRNKNQTMQELIGEYKSIVLEIMILLQMNEFDIDNIKSRCELGLEILDREIETNKQNPIVQEAAKLLNNLNVINKAKLELLLDPRYINNRLDNG